MPSANGEVATHQVVDEGASSTPSGVEETRSSLAACPWEQAQVVPLLRSATGAVHMQLEGRGVKARHESLERALEAARDRRATIRVALSCPLLQAQLAAS